ncbi:cornifelin homolog A-like [Betta splendens]|uniref:Cornifelin homolog A-like n=1 Tax=Betta splendens TaxID=158456 RepID=A0A6P7KZN5_BETSP|nr:cornifelin homolog A-like [Betta splendens]
MAQTTIINNMSPPAPPAPVLTVVHSNQWSTGICDCCDDMSICCFACWSFPCFACSTASEFGECYCLPVLDTCNTACIPPMSMAMRVAVRNHHGIQGDMAGDCMYVTFCNPCSWCQIAREIKRRKTPTHVITTQPVLAGGPQYMVANQPTVVAMR